MENKYKRLVSNTALFAISQFSSRLLFFVMAPLFSYWFDTQAMAGIKDLLNQFSNFSIGGRNGCNLSDCFFAFDFFAVCF